MFPRSKAQDIAGYSNMCSSAIYISHSISRVSRSALKLPCTDKGTKLTKGVAHGSFRVAQLCEEQLWSAVINRAQNSGILDSLEALLNFNANDGASLES